MKRFFVALAAMAMLLVVTETASARPWYGVSAGYGWGGPYVGASYGTRIGHNSFLSVGVAAPLGGYGYGYSYPSYGYGYSYAAPAYYSTPVYAEPVYVAPTYYYSTPAYYATPYYYGGYGPSISFSYFSGGGRHYRHWR
jgi:hypothetical protein